MHTKAILFDIDGTLVDSNEAHITAWAEAFREAGYHFSRDDIHRQVGKGGDNLVPSLAPDAPPEIREQIDKAHGERFKRDFLPRCQPFPGARELLDRARQVGLKIVLASSASAEELEQHLEKLGGAGAVDATTSKDDVEHSKPCPDIFAAALDQAGCQAGEALVIGDTPYDMIAARKLGIPAVAVRSGGFTDEELSRAGASAVYDDVAELLVRFEDLVREREAVA